MRREWKGPDEALRMRLCDSDPVGRLLTVARLGEIGTLHDIGLFLDLLALPISNDEHPRERAAMLHAMQRLAGLVTEPFNPLGCSTNLAAFACDALAEPRRKRTRLKGIRVFIELTASQNRPIRFIRSIRGSCPEFLFSANCTKTAKLVTISSRSRLFCGHLYAFTPCKKPYSDYSKTTEVILTETLAKNTFAV